MSAADSGGTTLLWLTLSDDTEMVRGRGEEEGEGGGREVGDMGSSSEAGTRPSFCLYSQFSSDKLAFSS